MSAPRAEPAASVLLEPQDNRRLASLCGPFNQNLKQIEQQLGVSISNRGHRFSVSGDAAAGRATLRVIRALYDETAQTPELGPDNVHLCLQSARAEAPFEARAIALKRGVFKARSPAQAGYIDQIRRRDLVFGVGPAGAGKTFLAVALAVEALETGRVERLVLTRPAVEAGERLGFLPGSPSEKVDPFLRPVYDALCICMGSEAAHRLGERGVIEVSPLAYMRGRSLNDAFVLLDEAQNTTREQMKMLLTRIGRGAKAVVTGDLTQIDLPDPRASGLRHATRLLRDVPGVGIGMLGEDDIVRHALVRDIVRAYAREGARAEGEPAANPATALADAETRLAAAPADAAAHSADSAADSAAGAQAGGRT